MKRTLISLTVIAGLILVSAASAQMKHDSSGDMHNLHHNEEAKPTEAGQGAFAAIAEIVSILENNEDTDWSKVDIAALREHLVDMNALTLYSEVSVAQSDMQFTFTVTGEKQALRAIQAMVSAHGAVLKENDLYMASSTLIENGAELIVTARSPKEQQKLKALGFFGLMATGAHHQEHHLQIAKGDGHPH